jgi:hypothetical protein
MAIILTIAVSNPTPGSRSALLNSIAQTLDLLGPEWNHLTTHAEEGRVEVMFSRVQVVGDWAGGAGGAGMASFATLTKSVKYATYSRGFP